jgi:hypothetical protein
MCLSFLIVPDGSTAEGSAPKIRDCMDGNSIENHRKITYASVMNFQVQTDAAVTAGRKGKD